MRQRCAAYLHFECVKAHVLVGAEFIAQARGAVIGVVITAGCIDMHTCSSGFGIEMACDGFPGRLISQFGVEVPESQLQRTDGCCAVAMAAGLFIAQHQPEQCGNVKQRARGIQQAAGRRVRCGHDARDAALGITADGVKAEPYHRLAIAHDIRHHSHQRDGVLRKINQCIGNVALQGNGNFTDVGDAHEGLSGAGGDEAILASIQRHSPASRSSAADKLTA